MGCNDLVECLEVALRADEARSDHGHSCWEEGRNDGVAGVYRGPRVGHVAVSDCDEGDCCKSINPDVFSRTAITAMIKANSLMLSFYGDN